MGKSMKYDFTTFLDRRGKDSMAADDIPVSGAEVREDFTRLPMWVADMNFPVFPAIQEHMTARIAHPVFGYFHISDEYYDSIINWQKKRNQVQNLSREAIGYENGVLGCVASALQAFTAPGESVLVHARIYKYADHEWPQYCAFTSGEGC